MALLSQPASKQDPPRFSGLSFGGIIETYEFDRRLRSCAFYVIDRLGIVEIEMGRMIAGAAKPEPIMERLPNGF